MLTEEEKILVSQLKSEGYQTNDIVSHIGARRAGIDSSIDKQRYEAFQQREAENEAPMSNKIAEGLGFKDAVDTFGSVLARRGIGTDVDPEIVKQSVSEPSTRQKLGAGLQVGSVLIPGGAGANFARQMGTSIGAGYLYDIGSDLAQNKSTAEALIPGAGTAAGALVPPVLRGAGNLLQRGAGALSRVPGQLASEASQLSESISGGLSDVVPQGLKQAGTEVLERFPRAIEKGRTALAEKAVRAERIKTAPPAVQNAIKSDLDEVLITAAEQADEPTRQAYRRMVDIAEQEKTGLRPSTRPESIAGEAVTDEYKILNKTRQEVGQQIGEAVDKLSKKGAVDVLPAQRQMRDILRVNGILPDQSGVLNFSGSALTPKQQTLVQQLYELATKSEVMTPRQVYNMDKLFSQLQREARFEGLDSIFLGTPEGEINAFRIFRNIYASHLDKIAPEIAPLNKQYAQLRNLQDDIEDSIVKRGNFDSNRDVDPSEFAQTNLRRIFSDAQSAADYRALADKLDAFARAKGYSGANPQDLAGFAQRLRQIFPETVPETSFQGGIMGGIKGVLGKVLDVGAPDIADKQKALRELLDSFNSGAIPQTTVKADVVIKRTADTSTVILQDLAKKNNVDFVQLNAGIDKKLVNANSWKEYIDNEAAVLIQGIPNTKLAEAPVKSKQRILEKTLKEEGGKLENIKDIARNTIVPETPQARAEVLKRMDARKDIARRKDQKPEDFMGYEGTIYNIKTPDGQIVETQVVSPEMTFGKNLPEFSKSVLGEDVFNEIAKRTGLKPGQGHEIYEKVRKLDESDPNYLELLKQYTQESVDYYSKLR